MAITHQGIRAQLDEQRLAAKRAFSAELGRIQAEGEALCAQLGHIWQVADAGGYCEARQCVICGASFDAPAAAPVPAEQVAHG